MSTQEFVVTIEAHPQGGYDVAWRKDGALVGAVPVKDLARAEHMKTLIERGVAPVEAILRGFRPRRRPAIGEKDATTAKYGRMGAKTRNERLTAARRREIATQAARARWGAGKPPKRKTAKRAKG